MADISTLGITYGVPVSGATLSSILNGNNIIEIEGAVVVNSGNVTVNNPSLRITSPGAGVGYIQVQAGIVDLVAFDLIDGLDALWASGRVRFPDSSEAKGRISNLDVLSSLQFGSATVNQPTQYNTNRPISNYGLRLVNIANADGITGHCSGVWSHNVDFNVGTNSYGGYVSSGGEFIEKINGRDNTFIGCNFAASTNWEIGAKHIPLLSGWGRGSNVNNYYENCTFSGGREEMVGWDTIVSFDANSGIEVAQVTNVTSNGSNVITVSNDTIEGSRYTNGTTNAVGAHVCVISGANAGVVYEISNHSTTQFTLTTDKFLNAEDTINVNDYVQIAPIFYNNSYKNCTINITATTYAPNGFGQHVGLSLWGLCWWNEIVGNTINNPNYGSHPASIGIYDCSVIGADGATANAMRIGGFNLYKDNTINNCEVDMLSQTLYWKDDLLLSVPPFSDENEFENLAKPESYPAVYVAFAKNLNPIIVGNQSTGATYSGFQGLKDAVYSSNSLIDDWNLAYDETYVSSPISSPQAEQGGLGGSSSSTAAPGYVAAEQDAEMLTLSAWAGATLHWKYDDDISFESEVLASKQINLEDEEGENHDVVWFYASEGGYTTPVQQMALAAFGKTPIFNPMGSNQGTILSPSGGSGGTIMRKKNGNWTNN